MELPVLVQRHNGRGLAAATTRVVVLGTDVGPEREAVLRALLLPAEVTVSRAGLPADLERADAVIIDGAPAELTAAGARRLLDHVARGAALLALAPPPEAVAQGPLGELLGLAATGPALPEAEVFAARAAESALTRRLDAEFPVVDSFLPLDPRGGARTVLTVSVALRPRPALVETVAGAGRVVVSGLGGTTAALRNPQLATALRRAVLGAAGVERDLGVGLVGYGPLGGMGHSHGLAVDATPGLVLATVCDSVPARCAAARADFPAVRTVDTVAELAADPSVDIVVIATPPALHAELALAMLRAGKHVVCEKPLCLRVADADLLIETARSHAAVLTVNQNRRWDQDFTALRAAVDAGEVGEVFNVETFVGGFEHPCRAWHSDVSLSGGAVYDWGSHHLDWILQLLPGMPETVATTGHKRVWHDVTNLDQVRVRLGWADGREAQFLQSDIAAVRPPKFYVQGTSGTLAGWYRPLTTERIEAGRGYVSETAHHAEAPVELVLRRYRSGMGTTETRIPPAPERRFAFHRNLADHLQLGEPLAVTAESVRRVIAVLEAAHHSGLAGGAPLAPGAALLGAAG
ncbi:MAG TPA: Gfo/Idh/MocA family oxidoreductase [Candidatus Dormibacteraeota bacterium]